MSKEERQRRNAIRKQLKLLRRDINNVTEPISSRKRERLSTYRELVAINIYPSRFRALRWALKAHKLSISVFENGRVNFQGARSLSSVVRACAFVRWYFGVGVTTDGIRINNFVGSAKYDYTFALADLKLFIEKTYYGEDLSYEPELFNGVVWKFGVQGRALLFRTGSVIITGCKTEEDVHEIYEKIDTILLCFDLYKQV